MSCRLPGCRLGLDDGRCAIDVARLGEHSPAEIAPLVGVSRQRVGRIIDAALRKLQRAARAAGMSLEDIIDRRPHPLVEIGGAGDEEAEKRIERRKYMRRWRARQKEQGQ